MASVLDACYTHATPVTLCKGFGLGHGSCVRAVETPDDVAGKELRHVIKGINEDDFMRWNRDLPGRVPGLYPPLAPLEFAPCYYSCDTRY